MIIPFETTDELDARQRISRLRQEIEHTTLAYQAAKEERRADEVATLLKKRSQLIERLFRTQRELLQWMGARTDTLQQQPAFNQAFTTACAAP